MPSQKSHSQPPTSVHHTPPSERSGGAETQQPSQPQVLRHNTEDGQAQPHPETPAGQHATGSFTSEKESEKKKKTA